MSTATPRNYKAKRSVRPNIEHSVQVCILFFRRRFPVEVKLTEAYYSVSIGRKTVKPSDRYTVYAAGWSRQATLLRAGVPLTCHLAFWALGNLPETPGLKNIDIAF